MSDVVAWVYEGTVLKWVDGDTVDLSLTSTVDFGFHFTLAITLKARFRLYGIDTPERGTPGYTEATAFNASHAPVGSSATVETFKSADKYGRWLATITPAGSEKSINAELVEVGLAVPYFGGTKTTATTVPVV